MPELQTPDTLIVKNAKMDEETVSNNDKNQEYIKPVNPKHRSFIKNFQQQTLPGWYFTPTIKGSLFCTGFCWLVLIILGIINIAITTQLKEALKTRNYRN